MEGEPVAFIGAGAMGAPMARNLLAAGYALTVYNRTPARAAPLVEAGARLAASPAQAVQRGGVVLSMLANDAALEAAVLGPEGFAAALGRDGLHVSMSTVSPQTSERLAQAHAAHGSRFLAAPVFGRPEAAAARKLWICVAGSEDAKRRARPLLEALGQGIHDFGAEVGAANVVKLSGNFLILAAVEALGEALAMAGKHGVSREALAAFLGQTMFSSPVYQNYGRILAGRSYEPAGFALELGLKDLRLVRETAERALQPMPIADLLHARLLGAIAKGRGKLDWSAIELGSAEDGGAQV